LPFAKDSRRSAGSRTAISASSTVIPAEIWAVSKLPAIYFERFFTAGGGLISYGPAFVEQYQQAAGYVDRILKGEKPADLPVQAPTKYVLTLNLKTAKALGLDVPLHLQQRADGMIE
jgi:putative ABC transport system substrate-binding protein